MESMNWFTFAIVMALLVGLVVFIIWKNQQDKNKVYKRYSRFRDELKKEKEKEKDKDKGNDKKT